MARQKFQHIQTFDQKRYRHLPVSLLSNQPFQCYALPIDHPTESFLWHQKFASESVGFLFDGVGRDGVHHDVAELVGQGKSHPIRRRITIEEYTNRKIADSHCNAIHSAPKITPNHQYPRAFAILREAGNRPFWNRPRPSNHLGNFLCAPAFIHITVGHRDLRMNIGRIQQPPQMNKAQVQLRIHLLQNADPHLLLLAVEWMHTQRKTGQPIPLKEKISRETKRRR